MARPPRTAVRTIATVAAVGVVAAGVFLGTRSDDPVIAPAAAPVAAPGAADSGGGAQTGEGKASAALFDGPKLPNVRASSTEGTVDLGKLKGPAIVHVYASWCSVCRGEAAELGAALDEAPAVKPIWIAVQDEPTASEAFAKEFDWPAGPRIDDPNRSIAGELGLTGQPNTVLVDAEGNTRTFAGAVPIPTLTALLRELSDRDA